MRLETNDTPRGVSLVFTDERIATSVTLRHAEMERLSVKEGINLLMIKLYDAVYPTKVPLPAEPGVEVQTPGEYLRERGHI